MHKTVLSSLLVVLCFSANAQAVVYNVNRTFGITNATLTGTVTAPLGNYVIQNAGASPFTNVNLSLTVNTHSFNLVNVDTSSIYGTGQFFIDATPTTLSFSTANANGSNGADLSFLASGFSSNQYAIGSDGNPRFEAAYTTAGQVHDQATFPVLFGTAVPEPSTFLLLGIGAITLLGYRKEKS